MTGQECLNRLHEKILKSSFANIITEQEICALLNAKDALEEMQQYRKLGTVEELIEAKNLYDTIRKTEDDMCSLNMVSRTETRERIKAMARQLKGKV